MVDLDSVLYECLAALEIARPQFFLDLEHFFAAVARLTVGVHVGCLRLNTRRIDDRPWCQCGTHFISLESLIGSVGGHLWSDFLEVGFVGRVAPLNLNYAIQE